MLALDQRHLVFGTRLREEIVHASLPSDGCRGERVVASDHHGANAHRPQMLEPFAHSPFDNIRQRDYAQNTGVLRHQKRRAAPVRNIRDALLSFFRDLLAAFGDMFQDRFRSALANLQAVEVHARHAGLGRKGNEDRIAMAKLATSQSIFILCEYHNGAPLGRLVCKRCKLRRIRQLGLSHIWAGIEHRCFAIAQRDRTGFVQEQHVDVSGCFHSAPRHGYDVSLDHAIHACDSDGRQKAADCGRD